MISDDPVREYFERMLTRLGLSEKSVLAMSEPELEDALTRLNDAIAKPEQFGTVELALKGGSLVAVVSGSGTFGILPLLLERKELVLGRLRTLRDQQRIRSLRNILDQVPDNTLKQTLGEELEALQASAAALASEDAQTQAARSEAEAEQDRERARALLEMDLKERRWALWSRFLARESIATILGAALLVLLGGVLMVAMFKKIEPSAIISNSFLVILGYFFGQSTERRSGAREGDQPDA